MHHYTATPRATVHYDTHQAILDEQWCGRDSRCGKVMLRRVPESSTVLLLQTVLNLFGVCLLELQANPDYPWQRTSKAGAAGSVDATSGGAAPNLKRSCAAPQLRARRGSGLIRGWGRRERTEPAKEGEQDVAVYEQLLHFYRIPAVKHMATLITTTLRYLLFVKVGWIPAARRATMQCSLYRAVPHDRVMHPCSDPPCGSITGGSGRPHGTDPVRLF